MAALLGPDPAGDLLANRLGSVRAPVQAAVAGQQLGIGLLQPGQELLLHPGTQVQGDRGEVAGPGVGGRPDHRPQLLGGVRDPGKDRRHQDPAGDAGRDQLLDRRHARLGVRRPRLAAPPHLLVQGPDGQVGREPGRPRQLDEQVEVPQQQRRLGQHRARVGVVPQHLQHPPRQPVPPLAPLIRVGVGPHRHMRPGPALLPQLPPQHLRRVDLDHDLALEVPPGVEVQVGVAGPGEAVVADRPI